MVGGAPGCDIFARGRFSCMVWMLKYSLNMRVRRMRVGYPTATSSFWER